MEIDVLMELYNDKLPLFYEGFVEEIKICVSDLSKLENIEISPILYLADEKFCLLETSHGKFEVTFHECSDPSKQCHRSCGAIVINNDKIWTKKYKSVNKDSLIYFFNPNIDNLHDTI